MLNPSQRWSVWYWKQQLVISEFRQEWGKSVIICQVYPLTFNFDPTRMASYIVFLTFRGLNALPLILGWGGGVVISLKVKCIMLPIHCLCHFIGILWCSLAYLSSLMCHILLFSSPCLYHCIFIKIFREIWSVRDSFNNSIRLWLCPSSRFLWYHLCS